MKLIKFITVLLAVCSVSVFATENREYTMNVGSFDTGIGYAITPNGGSLNPRYLEFPDGRDIRIISFYNRHDGGNTIMVVVDELPSQSAKYNVYYGEGDFDYFVLNMEEGFLDGYGASSQFERILEDNIGGDIQFRIEPRW